MLKRIAAVSSGLMTAAVIASVAFAGVKYDPQDPEMKKFQAEEIECLALNIYFETRAVSLADAMAVSDVVMNRVKSTKYPNTVCGVVHQGQMKPSWKDPNEMVMVRHKCQFSWYCDGKADVPYDDEAWEKSRKHARDMYVYGYYTGMTEGATHYHATWTKPFWAPSLNRVARIGGHIFYRSK